MGKRIVISGFGGQGIIALGKFIALTAMNAGKHVTYLPSYGAEVRGGTANCQIVISDEEIASPCIENMDILIAMNQPSIERFCSNVVAGGLIVVNTSLAAAESGAVNIPATEIAVSFGEKKVFEVDTTELSAPETVEKIEAVMKNSPSPTRIDWMVQLEEEGRLNEFLTD